MQHYYLLVGLGIFYLVTFPSLSNTATAQNIAPDKPDFEKTIYRADNGRLYIHKDLPVYLDISTSEDGGESYRLKSKEDKGYTNPMYFDTEGINYLRHRHAVDPDDKKIVQPKNTVKFEIYADSRSPQTSSSFRGAESYVSPTGDIYYGEGLAVNLEANDAVSGVKQVHYALNTDNYSDYSSTIQVSEEDSYDLYYFANDYVGNAEEANRKQFTVDLTPPETSKNIKGSTHDGNILGPNARYILKSEDELSGVRYTYYQINDGEFEVYDPSKPVYVSYLDDGTHSITYYSDDRVDNEESKETFEFYFDKIPPEVSLSLQGDQYEGSKYTCVSPRTKVQLSATDNKAGVKNLFYNIDSRSNETYQEPFKLYDEKGTQRIVYYGTDNVDNQSNSEAKVVYMDNQPPNTSISYGNPKFFNRDTLFINDQTNVRLTARDGECGVQETFYQVDGGSENSYSSPFNLDQEGYRNITFRSVDRVNNEEDEKKSQVFVDNTPPDIYHNFSVDPIGTKDKNGKTLKVYPNYTRLFLGSTDNKVGSKELYYSMSGESFKKYSSPKTLDISELERFEEEKYYKIKVRATDKLGNEKEETIEFFVGFDE